MRLKIVHRALWLKPSPFHCGSTTMACSRSPFASVSAFLQSIMPAPVFSRSAFTRLAVISAIVILRKIYTAGAAGASPSTTGAGAASGNSSAAPTSTPDAIWLADRPSIPARATVSAEAASANPSRGVRSSIRTWR